MNNQELYCDQCGQLITDDVYFIGKTKIAIFIHNPVFCSQECIQDYLQIESLPIEMWDEFL